MSPHKIGRNNPCSCGSTLKYKKCCLPTTANALTRIAAQDHFAQTVSQRFNRSLRTISDTSSPLKMSEVILVFAEDLLTHAQTQQERRSAIALACLAWNLAVAGESAAENFQDVLRYSTSMSDATRDLVRALVQHKQKAYPDFNRLVVDFQLIETQKETRLDIASVAFDETLASAPQNPSISSNLSYEL